MAFVWLVEPVEAQEKPPRPLTLSAIQGLNFGVFSVGRSGGTITIDSRGGRTVTGDILPLASMTNPACFEVDVEPGTVLNLVRNNNSILNNGTGGTLSLKIEPSPYVANGMTRTYLYVGGTLTAPPSAQKGMYSGEFYVTFIQE